MPKLQIDVRAKWDNGTILWLIAFFSVALAVGLALGDGLLGAIQNVLLAVVGVLIGLLVVPDEGKKLEGYLDEMQLDFTRSPRVIGKLTQQGFEELVGDVMAARVGPEVSKFAANHGWRPILDAMGKRPRAAWFDFDYACELTPLPEKIDGCDFYAARVTLGGRRDVPSDGVWVSFARTSEALRHEFAESGCLARELIEVSPATWRSILEGDYLKVKIVSEPEGEWRRCDTELIDDELVRFHFDPGPRSGQREVQLTERIDLLVDRDITYYPVRMASYFCVGKSSIELRIDDPDVSGLEAFPSLAGDMGLNPLREGIDVDTQPGGRVDRVTVTTSKKVVLWPGSGVIFVWRR